MHRGGCWGNLHERDHLQHLGIDGRIILLSSYNRDEKFPGARLLWRIDFVWWLYLWIPSTTVVSYHRSGTQSFVVALDFLENLCTPVLKK